jgi:hypothetical protein
MSVINKTTLPLAFLLVISITVGVQCLETVFPQFSLPGKAQQQKSMLEGKVYQEFPELTKASLMDGEFQSQFDQFANDSILYRDKALQINAALQRIPITLAAQVFHYNYCPTFYGSSISYSTSDDALFPKLQKTTADFESALSDSAARLNSFMAQHPEYTYTFAVIDRLEYSSVNPLTGLSSNTVTDEYMQEAFFNRLSNKMSIVGNNIANKEEYLKRYFKSDHHWNIAGAYEAYEALINKLKPEDDAVEIEETFSTSKPFNGSYARRGILTTQTSDTVSDILYSASDIEIDVDGKKLQLSDIASGPDYDKTANKDKFASRYGEYFHADYPLMTLTNKSKPNAGFLLIVADSYSNSIERLFAEHYTNVYVIDPRHYEGTLSSFLSNHEVNDILFLESPGNFTSEEFMAFIS